MSAELSDWPERTEEVIVITESLPLAGVALAALEPRPVTSYCLAYSSSSLTSSLGLGPACGSGPCNTVSQSVSQSGRGSGVSQVISC